MVISGCVFDSNYAKGYTIEETTQCAFCANRLLTLMCKMLWLMGVVGVSAGLSLLLASPICGYDCKL